MYILEEGSAPRVGYVFIEIDYPDHKKIFQRPFIIDEESTSSSFVKYVKDTVEPVVRASYSNKTIKNILSDLVSKGYYISSSKGFILKFVLFQMDRVSLI